MVPEILSRKFKGPRPLLPGETPALLRFLDDVFMLGIPRGLAGLLPHIFTDMEEHADWFNVITCEGRIVAHAGVTPLEFVMWERRMRVGAIGHVATGKAFRKRGLMSALLGYTTERMRKMGMPVSILWGDRVRYARFGWEPAGHAHHFSITPSSAGVLSACRERVERLDEPVRRSDELHVLHRRFPVRVERTSRVFSLMLEKAGIDVFAVTRGSRVAAYAVAREKKFREKGRKGSDWMIEEMGGKSRGILSILKWLAGRPGTRSVEGRYPLMRLPLTDPLLEAGSSWRSPVAMIGQIKVVDLKQALAGFGLSSFEREVRNLGYGGRRLVRTIFGPVPPKATLPCDGGYARLASRLPVDFHLWPSDNC